MNSSRTVRLAQLLSLRPRYSAQNPERQENIRSWLGASVVRRAVYHGTRRKFDQFTYQKSKRFVLFSEFEVEAKGFFFSESPHDALEFGPNVAVCYVRMVNPLLDPRRDPHLGVDRLPYQKEMHLLKILGAMVEHEHGEHYIDLGVRRVYLTPKRYEFPRQWIYNAVFGDGLDWDCLDNPAVVQRMVALGYDGTFVAEPDSSLGRSLFVPSADQVKIDLWVSGAQESWGEKDDYYTNKKDGLNQFYGPEHEGIESL